MNATKRTQKKEKQSAEKLWAKQVRAHKLWTKNTDFQANDKARQEMKAMSFDL